MKSDEECRCYVDHIVAQHRRLHTMLRQMCAAIIQSVQPDETPSFERITRILKKLREELERHFAQEEGGGCLDEAASRCPSLTGEEERIEAEHPAILAHLDNLLHQAQTLPPTHQNQLALQRAFDQLHDQLLQHELAENRLLAQGFGVQPNGDDADYAPLTHDV
jgi:hemerythrin